MDGLLYSLFQFETIAFIMSLAIIQVFLFYWIEKRTTTQWRKNSLKAYKNRTKNLIE